MKKYIFLSVITSFFFPISRSEDPNILIVIPKVSATSTIAVDAVKRAAWIDALEKCESGGNPHAINPKDNDGTPSYGSFQFKPETFKLFSKIYGIDGELMDPIAQRAIVKRMIKDPDVNIARQFPGCVRRLGLPYLLPF